MIQTLQSAKICTGGLWVEVPIYWPQFTCIMGYIQKLYHPIEGFHVTSYQANFASHHTRNRHVGFLFAGDGIGKHNKMFRYFLFSSYHITKLQLSDKNISTHNWLKIQILPWSKSKSSSVFFFFSPYGAAQKGNQEMLQNHAHVGAFCVVQSLY